MRKKKRFAAAALALSMAIGLLAGCGGKTNTELAKIDKNTIYREERLDINFPANFNVSTTCISGKTGYFSGYSYNEQTYEQTNLVQIVDLETLEVKTVDLKMGNGWVNNLIALSNGNFLVNVQLNEVDESDPDNPIYLESNEIRLYDQQGNVLKKLEISKEYPDSYVNNIIQLDDGFVINLYESRIVVDNDLNIKSKGKNDTSDDIGSIYRLKDGSFVTSKWSEDGGFGFVRINPETFETGEKVNMVDTGNFSVMQGKGCDFFFRNDTGIFKYNVGDEAPTPIFNFINSDLYTSYFNAFEPLDENSFIGTYNEWTRDKSQFNICKYTKVDPSEIKDKEVLSLGCVYIDSNLRKFVVDFNKSSDEYRINVVEYSSYNTNDDYMAGMNKFNSDIAAGKGPDIIVASNTDQVANYINKGLYADLTKQFENDPDLSLDSILPNVVTATSKDGKIYQVIPSVMIQTAVGKKSVLGDREGWTVSEMLDFEKSLKDGQKLFHEMTRESFLSAELAVNTSNFVDLSKAKCNFDSDEFKAVLEYMKNLKTTEDYYNELYGDNENFDWETFQYEVLNDKAVVNMTTVYGPNDYKNALRQEIGEELNYIGFPSEDKKGSCLRASLSIGISSKCRKQDGAWQLVRQFLLPDYQEYNSYGLPSTQAAFDKICEELKEKPYWYNEKGEKEFYDDVRYINGKEVTINPLSEEEVQRFKDFVYTVDKLGVSYTDIENIIYEEAAAFFEGQKSVDDVVKIIQSRASIFVSEKQ